MGETTTCGDDLPLLLPEDFCIQILVCLPIKSLLRFKSDCKSWYFLIQSSFFIDLHTTTFNSSSKFGTFILQTTERSDGKYEDDIKLYMLSSGDGPPDGDGDGQDDYNEEDDDQKKMVFKVDDLGFLPFYKDYELQDSLCMVGSCNGIICLHDPEVLYVSRGCTKQDYLNLRDVSLWNPATRQFRILPKSILINEEKQHHYIGLEDLIAFGFDVKTKDYKVLRIAAWKELEEGGFMCRVQVYSLSTDSWRLLEDIDSLPVEPTHDSFCNHGIYLNGSYFFVGDKSNFTERCDFVLLSFDFTKETFTTMQLPDDNRSSVVSSYLGEKLVVFTVGIDDGYEYYDIWVLNEQDSSSSSLVVNKKSWTKLHSFQIKSRGYPNYTEPRCLSNNGKFAIILTRTDEWKNKLQLFNLITKEAKNDFLIGTKVCRADVYKESLVSIMGGSGNGNGNGNGNVLLRRQLPTHGTTSKRRMFICFCLLLMFFLTAKRLVLNKDV